MALKLCFALLASCGGLGSPAWASGRIVVANDDWTFWDGAFGAPNDPDRFVQNVAAWFTGGGPGSLLVYSDHFGLTGANLANAVAAAGHSWTVSTSTTFDLATLQTYDAVFLGAYEADNQVLIDYVNGGGNVYVFSGAGAESSRWSTFLEAFGLAFQPYNNGIGGNVPINSPHPIFSGVDSLYQDNGGSVVDLDPGDPRNQVLVSYGGEGLYGIYDPVPEPATLLLLAVGGWIVGRRRPGDEERRS